MVLTRQRAWMCRGEQQLTFTQFREHSLNQGDLPELQLMDCFNLALKAAWCHAGDQSLCRPPRWITTAESHGSGKHLRAVLGLRGLDAGLVKRAVFGFDSVCCRAVSSRIRTFERCGACLRTDPGPYPDSAPGPLRPPRGSPWTTPAPFPPSPGASSSCWSRSGLPRKKRGL